MTPIARTNAAIDISVLAVTSTPEVGQGAQPGAYVSRLSSRGTAAARPGTGRGVRGAGYGRSRESPRGWRGECLSRPRRTAPRNHQAGRLRRAGRTGRAG